MHCELEFNWTSFLVQHRLSLDSLSKWTSILQGLKGFQIVLYRCGALSKLTLSFGRLSYSPEVPASPSTVRDLQLSHMVVAEPFLHNLQTLLPFLTELSFYDCSSPASSEQGFDAPSTLRWGRLLCEPGDVINSDVAYAP